jgi:hypothetical protein
MELIGVDSTNFTPYVASGTDVIAPTYIVFTSSAVTEDNTLTWDTVTDAEVYAVYRSDNISAGYGLIGETPSTSFLDNNFSPDTSEAPPSTRNPFEDVGDYPGAVGYYEQRMVFGGSFNKPDTSEFSQIANQDNFNRSSPTRADDAITATLSSEQVNEIRYYVGQNDLLTFTSGSEWRITSGPDQTLEPDTIQQKPQTTYGIARIPPIRSGNTILYITPDGANIRTIGYSLELDGYTGANLNILSQHLLLDHSIKSWAYVRSPESMIYIVRDDGVVLVLSYNQEQEVIAWTRWDTNGKFENVAALRGAFGATDKSYFVVKRTVDGNTVRYIETYSQVNNNDEVRDCFYVDSGLSLDVPIAITGISLTDPVVITAPSHGLSNGDTVDIFDIEWEPDVDQYFDTVQPDQLNTRRYLVANVTADTFEITDELGVDIDGTAYNAYVENGTVRKAVDTVSGLSHLEGRTVVALADGNVVSALVVTNGQLTFPRKFSRIHVGLRYITDIETLNIEVPDGTVQSYKKHISSVSVRFYQSRGLFVGPTVDDLFEVKWREFENMGDPTQLLTGDKKLTVSPSWNSRGRIFMRAINPLPLTILAVVPSFDVGEE